MGSPTPDFSPKSFLLRTQKARFILGGWVPQLPASYWNISFQGLSAGKGSASSGLTEEQGKRIGTKPLAALSLANPVL